MIDKLVNCRTLNTNLLLNFGPTKDGVFTTEEYKKLDEIANWMKANGRSVQGTAAINQTESSSVPATAKNNYRYLFLSQAPAPKGAGPKDETLTFKTNSIPKSIKMLSPDTKLNYAVNNGTITINVPGNLRDQSVDVVAIELMP